MADDNTGSWMDFAQRSRDEGGLGLAPHQAAGIVGNLQNESGSGVPSWGPTGDNGTAQGSAQWRNDRLDNLKAHAQANGLDYRTPEAQQAFMRHEFDTSDNGAYQALQAAQTPEQAAAAVDARYERSDGSTRPQRMAAARRLFDGSSGPTAIDAAMGRTRSTGSRMAFAPTDDEETPTAPPALSAAATLGPGQLGANPAGAPAPKNWLDILGTTLMNMAPGIAQDPENKKALVAAANEANKGKAPGTWSTHFDPATGLATQISSDGQQRAFRFAAPKADAPKWSPTDNGSGAPGYIPSPEEWKAQQAANAGNPQAPMIPMWGKPEALSNSDGSAPTPEQKEAYLKSMESGQGEMVRGLLENRLPLTAQAFSRKDSPYPSAFASAAKIDSTIDPTTYLGRQAGQRDWATKGAESARALNQTISHQSDVLLDTMKGLDNTQNPLWNTITNWGSENVQGSGKVPAFRTSAHAVVDELGKVFKQNNLSDAEIKSWESNLPANMSPEQQRAQIGVFHKLMGGAMSSLEDKRRQAIGPWAAEKQLPLLSEPGKAGLKKLEEFARGPQAASTAPLKPNTTYDWHPKNGFTEAK
jgi:hypothetical protein